jgi:hypothetical protein
MLKWTLTILWLVKICFLKVKFFQCVKPQPKKCPMATFTDRDTITVAEAADVAPKADMDTDMDITIMKRNMKIAVAAVAAVVVTKNLVNKKTA